MDEKVIHRLFPHRKPDGNPSYRRNQFETIRDAIDALENGVDDVIIEAPTGIGKTDIAKTVALYFTRGFDGAYDSVSHLANTDRERDAFDVMARQQAHMITSMKMLQDAYLHSRGQVCLVKGKSNYECKTPPKASTMDVMNASMGSGDFFSCQDAELVFGRLCKTKCPYLEARKAAQWSPIALFNFDSFINQVSLPDEDRKIFVPRRLLTIDEGHNTEEKLANSMSIELRKMDFDRLGLFWTKPIDDSMDAAIEWMTVVNEQITKALEPARQTMADMRKAKRLTFQQAKQQSRLARQIQRLEDMNSKTSRFLRSRKVKKPVDWVMEAEDESVALEPVTARPFMQTALLKYGEKRLHLSATFLDGYGVFRGSMKIKPQTTRYVAVPSTFPAESRPIIRRYVGDMGYRGFQDKLPDIAKAVQQILDENPGVRGLIHCTSYKLSQQIQTLVSDPRLLAHTSANRTEVVNKFTSSTASDLVLMGVALTEGYDFKGDLCRFQILIKIPYPYPTKRVLARKEKQPKYLDWRTCLTLVQSYGRGMRSEDDWCRTYVLDSRLDGFVKRNKKQLPSWFLDAYERGES